MLPSRHPRPAPTSSPTRLRIDLFLVLLVLVLAALSLQMFCGGDEVPRVLTGESALGQNLSPDRQAAVAHEALQPALSCEGMPETGEPVRFLMQNVQNYFVAGEQQRSRYVTKPKPEAERAALVRAMAKVQPDVIGLVEIGGPLALQDLRQRLEAEGLLYPYFRVLVRNGEDRALGILSRLPIVADVSRANMPLEGQGGRMMLRGLLDVTIRAEDGRLFRVLGVHLKSRVGEDPAAAQALRNKEARTLALYLQREMKRSPKMPLLVYGDWNDTPEDAAVKQVAQGASAASALCRLSPKDSHGEEWTHFYRYGKAYYAFDHILFNKVLHKRVKARPVCGIVEQGQAVSDHRALWCDLR